MFNAKTALRMVTLSGVVGTALALSPQIASAKDVIDVRCKSNGAASTDIDVRYREQLQSHQTVTRRRFAVEFHAATGGSLVAGQQVGISVDSVLVATVPLGAHGHDLNAEIRFDDNKQAFPANFPAVAVGSTVEVTSNGQTVLGCALH